MFTKGMHIEVIGEAKRLDQLYALAKGTLTAELLNQFYLERKQFGNCWFWRGAYSHLAIEVLYMGVLNSFEITYNKLQPGRDN